MEGQFVARKMKNVIGVETVNGCIRSCKLQASTWARLVNFGLGTDTWAMGDKFLSGQSSIMYALVSH